MHVRPLLFATTLLLVSALAWPAHAEVDPDDLGFDLVAAARYRKEKPLIVMTPSINVKKLQFKLVRSDGKKLTLRTGAIRADRTRKIAIPQGKGIYTYSCAITG